MGRAADGHLSLHCGPSRRRKLKAWVLLRLRYGFQPAVGDESRLLVWGAIRLRVLEGPELTLVSDSAVGDVLLRGLCGEL
ncbi:hypothetical protein [Solimonas sp. SE-A11]|uniref:hypothetical protein n=1 Tax=Solimonas sp. SE-A11 TaxID=3054954 RepID=UPI00259CDDB0|nr:hypothetical protein [Solimonas sp. SE-A11]MDM4772352.1 hypothetical protein [Solimonas sp. SE-A11]